MAEFCRNVIALDCSGDSKVLTGLDSKKIEVIVLDDQKSRELRRICLFIQGWVFVIGHPSRQKPY